MTKSVYDDLLIAPCPNCQSMDVEDSGDDCDGMVNCNFCGLMTPICYGTKSAIKVWNNRKNMEKWEFLRVKNGSPDSHYQI